MSNRPSKFQPDLTCKIQEDLINAEGVMLIKKEKPKWTFLETKGCNSKTNNLIWTVFEFVQDFIHVHLICKFLDDPIKTKQVMLTIM